MAHGGQKGSLGLAGLFGLLPGAGQRGGVVLVPGHIAEGAHNHVLPLVARAAKADVQIAPAHLNARFPHVGLLLADQA